jgi:D-cysteine desulfhydrase
MAGAEVQWITPADYARRAAIMGDLAEQLARAGRRPYVIPEGGSNAVGAWGYVRAAAELDADPGRAAGLPDHGRLCMRLRRHRRRTHLGAALLGWRERAIRLCGVNVCDDRAYFVRVIRQICRDFEERYRLGVEIRRRGHRQSPTATSGSAMRARARGAAGHRRSRRREALILDPVYTGKAFHGLLCELERDRARFGERVVFLHTGGISAFSRRPIRWRPCSDRVEPCPGSSSSTRDSAFTCATVRRCWGAVSGCRVASTIRRCRASICESR